MEKDQKLFFIKILLKFFKVSSFLDAEYKDTRENVKTGNVDYNKVRSSVRYSEELIKDEFELEEEYSKFIATPIP
jgi:hypothetical protein